MKAKHLNALSLFLLAAAVLFGLIVNAHAQAPAPDASVIPQFVGWVCSNQGTVNWLLGILLAHLGLSITSATLKKFGITSNSLVVQIIRLAAIDLKPPPQAIVAEADQLKAAGKA